MPQLDRIIIFTQIFWLFLIFSILYAILTHFFLPVILKSYKSRKMVIEANLQETNDLINKIEKKHSFLKDSIVKNLLLTENYVTGNLINPKFKDFDMKILVIDEKIARTCINYISYCNTQLLESIVLFSKF
uniref:ATP synthase F0 subunit 8 n=1 Tax=Mimica arnoldii TaxID=88407 RepID=UPI0027A0795F|nr:ATP synthase F0 subunit 8 [Mimica arnoldii]WGO62523.1 ATP synthase F0 subunit 8 [Mimica arnoldii]